MDRKEDPIRELLIIVEVRRGPCYIILHLVQEVATISEEWLSNQKEESNKTRILF
jgi:hypothetical protein